MASVLLLLAVFLMDVVAFGLAVAAEQRRTTSHIVTEGNSSYCVYDKDIATGLGVVSFLLLLVSQLLIMFASRCLCCGKALSRTGSRAWAIILFITCWVFFFIAVICLLAGSVRNAYHTKYRGYLNSPPSCHTLRKGVFGTAAAFILFTGIVSELFYVSYSKAKDYRGPGDSGIRMENI